MWNVVLPNRQVILYVLINYAHTFNLFTGLAAPPRCITCCSVILVGTCQPAWLSQVYHPPCLMCINSYKQP